MSASFSTRCAADIALCAAVESLAYRLRGFYSLKRTDICLAERQIVRDLRPHHGKDFGIHAAKEVMSGYECGIGLEKYNDIKEGDILEAYLVEEYRDA